MKLFAMKMMVVIVTVMIIVNVNVDEDNSDNNDNDNDTSMHYWSCFDIQLCNFEENVFPSRLTDWEFDKTASAWKIVTKTHSDTSVLFEYYGQRLL